MEPARASSLPYSAVVFVDGLGERRRISDATGEDSLEQLSIRRELTAIPSFEFALRERASRLANFRHTYFGRVRSVDRLNDPASTLAIVSESTRGIRLSHLLTPSERRPVTIDINASLHLMRQLVSAVAMLHESDSDIAHGAIAPERIVVTPNARVVILEYVLGAALEQLHYSPDRYWRELRIALPPSSDEPTFDQRADVTQLGVVGLSLILGRLLTNDEYPHKIREVLSSAWAISSTGGLEPLPSGLRSWLARALQLDPRQSFGSAVEAQTELDRVLSGEEEIVDEELPAEVLPTSAQDEGDELEISLDDDSDPNEHQASDDEDVETYTIAAMPTDHETVAETHVEIHEPAAPPPMAAMPIAAPQPIAATPVIAPQPVAVTPVIVPQPVVNAPIIAPPPVAVAPVIAAAIIAPPIVAPPVAHAPAPAYVPFVDPQPLDFAYTPVVSAAPPSSTKVKVSQRPIQPPPSPAVVVDEDDEKPEQDMAMLPPSTRRWSRIAAVAVAVLALSVGGAFGARRYFSPSATAVATGQLSITSTPAGAAVLVDGSPQGTTPVVLTLKTGNHLVELRGGGEPRTLPITMTAGAQMSQYVELPGGTASKLGQLQVRTEPAGAQVSIDGVARGRAPLVVAELTPGQHQVVLESDLGTVKQVVTIEAAATASLVVPMGGVAAEGAPVSGWIAVAAPVDLQIYENKKLLGSSQSDRIMVAAGRHDIEIVNEPLGYRVLRTVQVAPGKIAPIKLDWPKGTIALNAVPWAEVWVDGEKAGETPIGNLSLAIGPHEIVFRHPDLGEQRHAATVTVNTPARLSVDMRKKP
jgi:serine/threonine protein kinase